MNNISKYLLTTALATVVGLPAMAQENTDSVVNVAFRQVAKEDIMGGVSSLNYRELMEKNYNTYSLDNMQGYVSGYNGAGMWGYTDQLVLIDGVVRDANNVTPSEIESVTFLKGAQAVVLYGSRAAKGAVLITTKRGRVNDGLSISARANTGWNVAKSFPKYLGSAEYMTLYNEARRNDGLGNLYSQQDINNFASGNNPYRYPNLDFYSKDYVKDAYNRTDVTAEIEGGNQRARFYANVSYYSQGDYLKIGKSKNNRTDRFNVRGNVDMNLAQWLTAYVNANATYYNASSANGGSYWEKAATFRPNRVTPLIPISYLDPNSSQVWPPINNTANIFNGSFLAGTQEDNSNIFSDYYAAGDNTWTSRQFQFDAGVNVDLSGLLKGLSFHTMMAVDYATTYTTSYNNQYATFEPIWGEYNGKETIVGLNIYNLDKHSGQQNISGSTTKQTISFNAHFDYKRSFGLHNVNAMALVNGYQTTTSGEYHKISNANLGLQLDYDYAKTYYANLALAMPHSARLAPGHRNGFSYSGTLGWRIAKEKFMENSIFNELTLSASMSSIATDLGIDNFYMYLGTVQSGGWWDWNGGSGHSANQVRRGANEKLDFIKRNEFSANLHAEVLDRALSFDASVFSSNLNGQIITASSTLPSWFMSYYPESSFLPYINYNNDRRTGFDLALNYKKQLGEVYVGAGLNLTHYTTKATKRDDTTVADEYQHRQGKMLDGIWGYECLGFFKDEQEIADAPKQALGSTVRPGDLRYKDQNGDGVIDDKDQVLLAKGGWYGAPTTLGLNLTLKYKNFTLFMLGTGGFGGHATKSNSYWWVSGNGKYSEPLRGRAIVEDGVVTNLGSATYPRLTTESGSNNFTTSSFWIYSTDRFDLAKVQLTYDFPKTIIGNGIVKGLQVYVSGNSLLTFSKNREILEMNVGSAPQARFYNLGVKVDL